MMVTPAAAYRLDEAELSSLRLLVDAAATETDRGLEEDFRALQAKAAELQDAEERPGEAFAEELRKQIVFSEALRVNTEDLAAAAHRVQGKNLRRLAAQEHLVGPNMQTFLAHEETDSALERDHVSTPKEREVAAAVEDAVVLLGERLARMSARLRRGVAGPSEEAFMAGLLQQADNADVARATVEAFTASVRRFRAAGSGSDRSLPPDGAGAAGHTRYIIELLRPQWIYAVILGSLDDLDY
ncbi:hypothetical protein QOZ80_2BG0171610 [Eleusine coracana subsp. coracana]|nr:hypothetical protein QOZ80_2BG0171610 [Eleusine coracana subsp. coracana]